MNKPNKKWKWKPNKFHIKKSKIFS
jgi:hypothetical protein